MTDLKTIRIPEEDFKRHNERRKKMGLKWREYIDGEAPPWDESWGLDPDVVREIVREEVREALHEVAR